MSKAFWRALRGFRSCLMGLELKLELEGLKDENCEVRMKNEGCLEQIGNFVVGYECRGGEEGY